MEHEYVLLYIPGVKRFENYDSWIRLYIWSIKNHYNFLIFFNVRKLSLLFFWDLLKAKRIKDVVASRAMSQSFNFEIINLWEKKWDGISWNNNERTKIKRFNNFQWDIFVPSLRLFSPETAINAIAHSKNEIGR